MKRKFRYFDKPIFILLLAVVGCTRQPSATVEVNLQNAEATTKVSLYLLDFGSSRLIDSVSLSSKKLSALFKLYEGAEPLIAKVSIGGKNRSETMLIVEEGQNIKMTIDPSNPLEYIVEGSEESALVKTLDHRLQLTKHRLDSLKLQASGSLTRAELESLELQRQAIIDSQRVFSTRFVWEHPMARASVVALYQQIGPDEFVFDREEDLLLYKMVGTSLLARYPESGYSQGMLSDIKEMSKRLRSHKVLGMLKDAQSTLPEIVAPNTKGDSVRLSSFKGKVIILNFWASWNIESRMTTQELSELSRKLRDKPVVLFNVALDIDGQAWRGAIEEAKYAGIHVCELDPDGSKAAATYNVTSLPSNYVIDKNYDIIGKNVNGESLERMVNELLK